MNILLKMLPRHLPVFIRKGLLSRLIEATADAFASPAPTLRHLTYAERLRAYALFSREQARKALQDGQNIQALKARLYENAYALGKKLRKWLAVKTNQEVMDLCQRLYQAIEIQIEGDSRGCVTVRRCYFSSFYSSPVCCLISALDDGIFAGLSRGCRLKFYEQMTQGSHCCKAVFQ